MPEDNWKKLQFTNMFGFIDIDGTGDSGNFAVATHLKNKDVLGLSFMSLFPLIKHNLNFSSNMHNLQLDNLSLFHK